MFKREFDLKTFLKRFNCTLCFLSPFFFFFFFGGGGGGGGGGVEFNRVLSKDVQTVIYQMVDIYSNFCEETLQRRHDFERTQQNQNLTSNVP